MSAPEIANLLRAIADLIERNNSPEIAVITAAMGQGSSKQRGKKSAGPVKVKETSSPDLAALATFILESSDRAEAKQILERENLTRRELMKLGQTHNVHIVKEDTIDLIEDKIVEALVGSRLSSKAIRGER